MDLKPATINVMGKDVFMNLYGRIDLLLTVLHRCGFLPELMAYSKDDTDDLYINEHCIGSTDESAQIEIWKAVENYHKHGFLFE